MSVARYKSNTQEVDVVHFTVGNKNAVIRFLEDSETMVWIRCSLEDEYNILCLDKEGFSHQLFENCYVLFNGESIEIMQPKDFEEQYTLIQEAVDDGECVCPTIVENENNTPTDYRLDITDINGTFTTPNLIGPSGTGAGGVETDPTVPAWAKTPDKPEYSYGEIKDTPTSLPANGGNADTVNNLTVETAVPENAVFTDTIYDDTDVKTRLDSVEGDVTDLQGRVTGLENGQTTGGILVETDPTVPAWAKEAQKPSYDYTEIQNTPASLPAAGGNADTVNNFTVETNVPADAKFTDTVYDDTALTGRVNTLEGATQTLQTSITDLQNNKQNALTQPHLDAINSGITEAKVTKYDDSLNTIQNFQTALDGKQDKLSTTQLEATDSGITADKVTSYDNTVTELATLTGRVDDVETELDTKTSIDDTQATATTTYSSNKIDESLELKQNKLVGGVKQFVGFDENGNAKAVDNLYSESTLASVVTENDFTENDSRTFTIDDEGTIVADSSFRLAFSKTTCEPCLNFGGVYSLEWEVARYVHYIALERNPENGSLLLIALGGGDTNPSSPVKGITGMVIKIENGVQTILRQYYDTSLTPIQYLFKAGDKVRAVRNEDGSITFYRTTNANNSFTEWFTTDIKDIFPEKILGLACGFTAQEFITPFEADDMKVANKVHVQKTYNPDIEFLRDEISKKEDTNKVYDKFVVVAVAGQSNAVGYDESPVLDTLYTKPIDNDRIRQLGFYGDDNLELIPLGWCAQNMQDMRVHNRAGTDTAGTKGIHLPLANTLLEYIPDDYGILILPIAFGGTGFNSGNVGTYDSTLMKPTDTASNSGEGTTTLRWGIDTAYYQTLRDRIKHSLELNSNNKFAGIVWLQGENDNANATNHKTKFEEMTSQLFNELNTAGLGNRTPKGAFDKDIWYNVETVAYWYSFNGVCNIWSNYKSWNPKTYIEIPRATDSNAINGTGSTSSTKPSHFGNDAFSKVVAPRVAQALLNGNAFSYNAPTSDNTPTEAIIRDNLGTLATTINPYGANAESYRVAISSDFTVNHATNTFSIDSDGTITSSSTMAGNFAWATCEPFINLGDIYSFEFEVSRSIYWIVPEGNINNKELTLIGLGGGSSVATGKSGQIGYVTGGAYKEVKASSQTAGIQYNFVEGDKVRVIRNRDKSVSFYRTNSADGVFQHWFTYPKFSLVEGDCFGVVVGIAGNESNGVGTGDQTVVKKLQVQKTEISITNKYFDFIINDLKEKITNMYLPSPWVKSSDTDFTEIGGTIGGTVNAGSIEITGASKLMTNTNNIKGIRFTLKNFSGNLNIVLATNNGDNHSQARSITCSGDISNNYQNWDRSGTNVIANTTAQQIQDFFSGGGTFEIILSNNLNTYNTWATYKVYRVKDGAVIEDDVPNGNDWISRIGFLTDDNSSGTISNIQVWER